MKLLTRTTLISVSLLVALSGCSRNYNSYLAEAGDSGISNQFGGATENNLGIQTGDQSFVMALGNRFAAEVPTTVNFEFNSAVLDQEARETLRKQADWIRQFPEVRFRVYGYTDAVGSQSYNKSLGLRRAKAVVSYLSTQGISRSRLEALVSFGETQPVIVTQEPERRNRRSVTEVTGFVSQHQNVLDGKYAQIIYREYVNSATGTTVLTGVNGSIGSTNGG